jgi:hypothetical protein
MGNIKNYNFNLLKFQISNSQYWDFFLVDDDLSGGDEIITSGDCFVVWYDFNNPTIFPNNEYSATTINSLVYWTGATNTGYTFNTIGLTGIDNGFVTFEKLSADTSNQALLSALTGSTLIIASGDSRLQLTRVTGTTGDYVYPITKLSANTVGTYMNFDGGFYQGFYKVDGYSYQVLPNRVHNAWSAEFWVRPLSGSTTTGTTLNNLYPENKGFFFYIGTRAENKFWNNFGGVDSGCTIDCTLPSGCTDTLSEWCTIPKENQISILGEHGISYSLDPPRTTYEVITNQFLIYGRSNNSGYNFLTGETGSFIYNTATTATASTNNCYVCGGNHDGLGSETVCSYNGNGIIVVKSNQVITNNTNPFLVYGRAGSTGSTTGSTCCSGPGDGLGNKTVNTFTGFTKNEEQINYNLDIIDNAIGFRITDDGSIGYRLLTVTGFCSGDTYYSGVSIDEKYSVSGMVNTEEWSYITIRFKTNYYDDCQLLNSKRRTGKLMFYVDAKLKYVVDEFPEFIARRIDDYKDKQIGVPFNISLGGGSQGLIESQTFDGLDDADRGLPIQENFGGSFIGDISQFKFNICDLTFNNINYNFNLDKERYGK